MQVSPAISYRRAVDSLPSVPQAILSRDHVTAPLPCRGAESSTQLNLCEVRKILKQTGLRTRDENACVCGHVICLNVCALDLLRADVVAFFFLAVVRTQQGPGAPGQAHQPTVLIRTEKPCEPCAIHKHRYALFDRQLPM